MAEQVKSATLGKSNHAAAKQQLTLQYQSVPQPSQMQLRGMSIIQPECIPKPFTGENMVIQAFELMRRGFHTGYFNVLHLGVLPAPS